MTFLYLNSGKMGNGDDTLGTLLLESFLDKLVKSDVKIDLIGCVNSGVKLTTAGSQVIDILKELESKGAKISSCGTCLEFFKLKDKLLIGEIGTMEQTVKLMATADKIIRP